MITNGDVSKCFLLIFLQVTNALIDNESCEKDKCHSEEKDMTSQALVLYDESLVSPFHKTSRTFSFAGKELVIKQEWKTLGIAAVVWDAAIVLCEYLEKNVELVNGKKVIELGAGSGIVGIVAALLGGKVTITDLDVALEYINEVVEENLRDKPGLDVQVKGLDWTKDWSKFSADYDIVLGADIIYIEELFDDLLKTFLQICHENTVVVLSWRYRYDRDNQYLDLMRKHFTLKKIFYDSSRDVKIYLGKLIQKNKVDVK
ncbi:protein N-lysine methyltransferase METTL21A-like [Ylistrum balloti]|uniref:protein N-lysine methyltransferase METTL21A-like n=1 Tax=Ylistrum balloti TaxID=509963 RepID=UPI002905E00F|nr:protein N-lysine methyltransferase METTL21A-like [Ylistrum balloti]